MTDDPKQDGRVTPSAYRKPVTAGGLRAIEEGTLTWLDENMYNNLNTGVLEQYLEEKNLDNAFSISRWTTSRVMIGVIIGCIFAAVTAYISLKIGLGIAAGMYVTYVIGMSLRWTPSEVNIAMSSTTGATYASTGFVFSFPAIFLLAKEGGAYVTAEGTLITLGPGDALNLAFIGIVASMFAGFLGVMYFIIFRRVWLVEDPLPMPGFEARLKMLDISSDVNSGAVESARDSLKTIGVWTGLTMLGMFIIEYPLLWLNGRRIPVTDYFAERLHLGGDAATVGLASVYHGGKIHQPVGINEEGVSNGYAQYRYRCETDDGTVLGTGDPGFQGCGPDDLVAESNPFAYTDIGIYLTPSVFAIGWFMRTRVAMLVNSGTIFAWLFLVPLAVLLNVPIYDASLDMEVPVRAFLAMEGTDLALQMRAFGGTIRTVAIGAIIGGGVFGLLKMWGTFANIFGDIRSALSGEESTEFIEGKGWYEWPMKHIPIFMVIAFFGVTAVFLLGGFSAGSAAVFGIVLLSTTFLLGAIAVRVMGETSIEPVSGTSFIVLLLLLSVFLGAQDLLGLTKETAIMLGLVGVTVFGSAITMSGSVIDDYKNSLYIGTRPYHISKGNIVGVIPGTIIGAGIAIYLSIELANGTIDLDAPQANAFATFSIIVANGQGDLMLLGLGFLLGCFVEWATGMGTSFGLGMYLNLGYTLPMLIGGAARDRWERTVLDPKISEIASEEGDVGAQKQRALILLTTFMIAAGLTVGEAFFGTLSTVFLTIDNVVADPTSIGWFWLRLGLFLGLFTALAGGIALLFQRAGIIGGPEPSEA